MTYHCKLLEEYHLDITDRILTVPAKLKNFCQNTLSLCLGVGHGCDVKAYDDNDILCDVLNDEVIARSRKCLYVTNSSRTSCAECHKLKLLSDLKSDLGENTLWLLLNLLEKGGQKIIKLCVTSKATIRDIGDLDMLNLTFTGHILIKLSGA